MQNILAWRSGWREVLNMARSFSRPLSPGASRTWDSTSAFRCPMRSQTA